VWDIIPIKSKKSVTNAINFVSKYLCLWGRVVRTQRTPVDPLMNYTGYIYTWLQTLQSYRRNCWKKTKWWQIRYLSALLDLRLAINSYKIQISEQPVQKYELSQKPTCYKRNTETDKLNDAKSKNIWTAVKVCVDDATTRRISNIHLMCKNAVDSYC